ncbi:hypothetical protein HK107_02110 [Parvularcula sp. ZS-1/3]|uniref:Uncharacterized protein n=1 Tax=Parvularcula mediterranea TaxID=2732508 RepID=A0A7Y3RKM5_9PROT|nr:hypothetical protein [Parvularcula mediterranea]NNU15117.1 hypothetical protein [Parvularcula mediterranea]
MQDLAMVIHFKTRNRGAAPGGPAGGYAWVYGRFEDFDTFEEEVTHHFRRHFRYDVVSTEEQRKIDRTPEDPKAAALVAELDSFPIQYRSMHLYPEG